MSLMEHDQLGQYHDKLLTWFSTHRRSFPWRLSTNPYAIMIAEKLLQQTAATGHVVRVYEAFLVSYPTVRHLSVASSQELEGLLGPLGFAYRAAELCRLAQYLVNHHDGQVPRTLKELDQLPGVGEYCARAVLSFAYEVDVAVVDTNVARLLYRLYGLEGALPANPARKKHLVALGDSLVPVGRSREYNFAVLDLCAQICRPKEPRCPECPISKSCSLGSRASD
jgi:A/G-specific adenine glycosylase